MSTNKIRFRKARCHKEVYKTTDYESRKKIHHRQKVCGGFSFFHLSKFALEETKNKANKLVIIRKFTKRPIENPEQRKILCPEIVS